MMHGAGSRAAATAVARAHARHRLDIARLIPARARKVARRFLAYLEHRRRRREWQAAWSRGVHPIWETGAIPVEIRDAVEQGWFPSGAPLLDIGCGTGDIAAWLARQGFEVVACDFAEGAIRQAQAKYAGLRGRLTFRVVDICREAPGAGRFGALLDRGCFRFVHPALQGDYARNVVTACAPGARFLLLEPLLASTRSEMLAQVQLAFRSSFDIVRSHDTVMAEEVAGLAVWMIRR